MARIDRGCNYDVILNAKTVIQKKITHVLVLGHYNGADTPLILNLDL